MPEQGISIIIPMYNKWELTEACLVSLRKYAPACDFEVVAVDNASSDATKNRLEALGATFFPGNFTRIRNRENRNFSGACNQGARASRHALLFFLNNDTILTSGWDVPLRDALRAEASLAAVGPLLLYGDGTVQHLGAAVYPDRSLHHFYTGISGAHPLALKRRSLNYITAAALLVRASAFFAAGAFHEGYVNGLEDVELCYRLRQAGYGLRVEPDSVIFHLEGQTRNESSSVAKNAPLLRARCPDLRKPEFHHIALSDGYQPYFGLFFETFLAPLPERRNHHVQAGVLRDKEMLVRVMREEIYWKEGYLALAALCEQSGDRAGALDALVACSHQYPALDVMEKALALATEVGNTTLAEEYAQLLETARTTLQDADFFRVRHDLIAHTAESLADRELETMLTGWREEHGHTFPATQFLARRGEKNASHY